MPDSVVANETEVRIEMSRVGLLDEGCRYGSHTETLVVRGTGEARLRFEVFSQQDCPPEIVDFEVSRSEFLQLLNELVATQFSRLEGEYSGQESFQLEGKTGQVVDTLIRVTMVTSHAGDTTVTLKMGAYEHSVHWHHGAEIPGLDEWRSRWVDALEKRAEFRRHGGG